MREIRLYTPQPLAIDATIELDGVAVNHLSRVLRARTGDAVTLFNGDGTDYRGEIVDLGKRHVHVALSGSSSPNNESPISTHLGLCISKGDRFDWAIQKATELGVSEITPVISERVDVKLPADRMQKKQGHWQQVVASACEQCGRAVVPVVHAPQAIAEWVAGCKSELKLVLHHHQDGALPEQAPRSVALLVGPEGGLTPEEVDAACAQGFQSVRFGPRVLRTETAPAVALSILGVQWGDMS